MIKKQRFFTFAVLFIILVVAPVIASQTYNYLLKPASTDKTPKIFVITPGQPISQIAKNLEKEKLIKNAFAFRLLVSQMGIAKTIQAGDFRLSSDLSSREIASLLTHGAIDVWLTLPEGLRVEEQAAKIEQILKFGTNDKYQFDKARYIKIAKEGYMFPDTYLVPKDATAGDVAAKLTNTFEQKVPISLLEKGTANNLTSEEVVTLASLIEREARSNEERPLIAGILNNRLKVGMALQVDATVQYAKGYDTAKNSWWPQVSTADYRQVVSAYNTYLSAGLPPAPIASPGLESIRAAASPANTDYYYYLHDSDGKIHFAKTMEEHNENIRRYLFQ